MKYRKIYVAASVVDVVFAREIAAKLLLYGHTITSDWLFINFEAQSEDPMSDIPKCVEHALKDLYDIDRANTVLFVGGPSKSAGKNVEFGYAWAKGKSIYTIGTINSIFHALVPNFSSVEEFISRLERNTI